MKPTDEECREVASEMRQRGYEGYLFVSAPVALEMGIDIEDYDEDFDSFSEDAWNRLADLIEPAPERTCRAEVLRCREDDDSQPACLACSECGEKLRYREVAADDGEPDYELLPYCAGCGARVEGAVE